MRTFIKLLPASIGMLKYNWFVTILYSVIAEVNIFRKESNMSNNKEHKVYNKGSSSDFIVRVKSGQGMSVEGKIEHIQTRQAQFFNDYLEMLMLIQENLMKKDIPSVILS